MMYRRRFLRGAGMTLALPFLEHGRPARAATVVPKRLVVFIHGEGTLNHSRADLWTPRALSGARLDVSDRPMLDMLVPHQNRMVVVRGIDNAMLPLFKPGNGHIGPGHTYLTAHLPRTAVDAAGNLLPRDAQAAMTIDTRCVGPSFDHYLAGKLGGPDSLHLAVTEPHGGEYQTFYKTSKDTDGVSNVRAGIVADPVATFNQYIAKTSPPTQPNRLDRFRGKRGTVLNAVRQSFNDLYNKVGTDDRRRLQAHAQRIQDLEATLATVPLLNCQGATPPTLPGVPRWGNGSRGYEKILSTAQIDNLVQLLACGARNVMTLTHDNYDSPLFSWLANESDVPEADRGNFPISGANWHARVHRDMGLPPNHPILIHGFRSYGKQFRYLLDRMQAVVEPNGMTLLDNSLVLWISEFGDGGSHNTNNLPVVLAGGLQGNLRGGRFIDVSARRVGQGTGIATGDLYTSILKLFGFDETFGFQGAPNIHHGGVPDLV